MGKIVKKLAISLFFCNIFVNAYGIAIADKGTAEAVIVIDKNADKPEQFAAEELANFLGKITGAQFEIVNEAVPAKNNIFVGPDATKIADTNFSTDGLGTDGIVIKTIGNNLILAGGKPRGTLYAVYTFLEDYAGCRWWTSTSSTIPSKPSLVIENLNIRYVPVFEYRDMYTSDTIDPNWSVRNKRVGLAPGAIYRDSAPLRGGCLNWWPTSHSFYTVLPPEKYFEQHPEWYSLINGKRTASPTDHASLCLTNREMRKQYAIDTIAETKKDPTASYACIGAPDDSGYPFLCQCADCAAIMTAPNPPSELLTQFTNEIAAVYAKEMPDIKVKMTAYHMYRKPPVISKPADNVIIKLCTIEKSCGVPISHERNFQFRDDMLGWLKIAKSVYIYDYGIDFDNQFCPHPNLRSLSADIKFYAENGIKGVFIEAGANPAAKSMGYEIEAIRSWVASKLMWNPSLNAHELIEDFANGYYGPAGKDVLGYIDVMHNAAKASGDWMRTTGTPIDAKFLSIETLDKAWSCLKAAEAAVKDDKVLLSRVQSLQLSVLYPFIVRWAELQDAAMCRGIKWPLDLSIQNVYNYFIKVAAENNINIGPKTQTELAKALNPASK
ncbi:MAG: hypothetical protein A2Y13_12825 [Planctomycetes bacterium GWC2_45_44]|nr:MAG: hypothetical protein A2Y13_12825 [Planctomycetes bacterium GWC2_45_44]